MNSYRTEPTIEEMLDDPAVQAVMRRDGVSREEIEHLIRIARLRQRWTGQVCRQSPVFERSVA